MGLTLGSSITELILEIGNILNSPDNNATTFALEIPNQSFFLEINVKPKKKEKEVMNPYVVKKIMRDENSVFDKDNNYHKQKEKERHNSVFKRKNSKKVRRS